jgi:hypothetical protein
MTYIELPRALEDYFAYAEIDPTRNGRRFSISLPYFDGDRLDRLQWWYHLNRDQEERLGDSGLATLRAQATERFHRHIERWLQNTGQRLYGADPIPRVALVTAPKNEAPLCEPEPAPAAEVIAEAQEQQTLAPWPAQHVANG